MSFLVFLWEFQSALTFTLRSWIQFELVSVQKGEERGGGGILFHSSACSFPAPFLSKTMLFLWYVLGIFVKKSCGHSFVGEFRDLLSMSVLVPMPFEMSLLLCSIVSS